MTPDTPLPKLHADFHLMHSLVHSIGDADPTAALLTDLYHRLDLTGVERLRFTMTYLAVQHLGSATAAFDGTSSYREMIETLASHTGRIHTGPERRGHQLPKLLARHFMHLERIADDHDGLDSYLYADVQEPTGATPHAELIQYTNWSKVYRAVERIFGNGPWAASRTCRLLVSVHGWPLVQNGWNNRDVPGQRRALTTLYPHVQPSADPKVLEQFDSVATILQADLQHAGLPWQSHQVAASLELFDRMLRGRYYPGMNIDQQWSEIPPGKWEEQTIWLEILKARSAVFPANYLAEHNPGFPDPMRPRIYKLQGKVPHR